MAVQDIQAVSMMYLFVLKLYSDLPSCADNADLLNKAIQYEHKSKTEKYKADKQAQKHVQPNMYIPV